MKATREIYYIIFNKHTRPDGKLEADNYQFEIESVIQNKVPKSITIRDEKVTVTFTDESRHVFPYNENVEFFDRLIDKKDGKTENNAD
jgi:hypothetical protein